MTPKKLFLSLFFVFAFALTAISASATYDLEVDSLSVNLLTPPAAGAQVHFDTYLSNHGNETAYNVNLTIYKGDNTSISYIFPYINAGSTIYFDPVITYANVGVFTVITEIDANKAFNETDETNNLKIAVIDILPKTYGMSLTNVAVSAVRNNQSTFMEKNTYFTAANTGNVMLNRVSYSVTDLKNGNGDVLGASNIVINPTQSTLFYSGTQRNINLKVNIPAYTPTGVYTGNITADYGNSTVKSTLTVSIANATKILTVTDASVSVVRGNDCTVNATATNTGNTDLTISAAQITGGFMYRNNSLSYSGLEISWPSNVIVPGASVNIQIHITGVAANQTTGAYVGNLTVNYGGLVPATSHVTVTVNAATSTLSVPSSLTFTGSRNNTYSNTFTVSNTGNVVLNNIHFDAGSIASKYKVTFSTADIASLNPGQTSNSITLSAYIPSDESSGAHSIGTVKVTSSSANATFELRVNAEGMLIFSRIDAKINGKSDTNLQEEADGYTIDKDVTPANTVELKIKVKNDYSDDTDMSIKNIKITAKVDDLDIEEETENEFDLKEQKTSNEIILTLTLPVDVEEEKYELEIHAEGENENDYTEEVTKYYYINVVKESTDLRIYVAEISPSTVSCDREATLNLEVINFGAGDEDDVVVSIESSALGIDITEEVGTLSDDLSDEDSRFKNDYTINVPENLAAGTYTIKIQAFTDTDDPEDFEEVALVVNACTSTQTDEDETDETDMGGIEIDTIPSQPETATETTESFMESDTFMTLMAIVMIIVLGLIIYGIGALTIRKH